MRKTILSIAQKNCLAMTFPAAAVDGKNHGNSPIFFVLFAAAPAATRVYRTEGFPGFTLPGAPSPPCNGRSPACVPAQTHTGVKSMRQNILELHFRQGRVPLKKILWREGDWDAYNFSFLPAEGEPGLAGLSESVSKAGLLQPVLLLATGATYAIIAGTRRIFAARRAGLRQIPACLCPPAPSLPLIWRCALESNTGIRKLGAMEKARAAARLLQYFNGDARPIVREWAAKIGMPANAAAIETYAALAASPEIIQTAVAGQEMDERNALLLAQLRPADQIAAFQNLFVRCRPSFSEGRELLRLAMDLAVQRHIPLRALFEENQVAGILQDPSTSPKLKSHALRKTLSALRFPERSARMVRFSTLAEEFHRAHRIRILPPESLEHDTVHMQLSIEEAADLMRFAQRLRSPDVRDLYGRLIEVFTAENV